MDPSRSTTREDRVRRRAQVALERENGEVDWRTTEGMGIGRRDATAESRLGKFLAGGKVGGGGGKVGLVEGDWVHGGEVRQGKLCTEMKLKYWKRCLPTQLWKRSETQLKGTLRLLRESWRRLILGIWMVGRW